MKKVGKIFSAVGIFALVVFGIIKGIKSFGKLGKGKEDSSLGKSIGQTVDSVIMKYNDIIDKVKNNDGKGEEEIDKALEMAKQELDKAAQSAKKALAQHT